MQIKNEYDRKLFEYQYYFDKALEKHRPSHVFCLFSGGHDSVKLLDFFATELNIKGDVKKKVAYIDTGIGMKQNKEFVKKTCNDYGLDLKIIGHEHMADDDHYKTPPTFKEVVKEHGFPGPGQHDKMYNFLKGRRINKLVQDHKEYYKDRIMLITGVRKDESVNRMKNTEVIQRDGAKLWVAPIAFWSDEFMMEYGRRNDTPRNPIVDLLEDAGVKDCGCGAFAHKGEREELEMWFPEFWDRLKKIEDEVKEEKPCPNDLRKHYWGWGAEKDITQTELFDGKLCSGCNFRAEKVGCENNE